MPKSDTATSSGNDLRPTHWSFEILDNVSWHLTVTTNGSCDVAAVQGLGLWPITARKWRG